MAKCSECGFLAIWHRQTRQWSEADEFFRYHGELDDLAFQLHLLYQPMCFVQAADLHIERQHLPADVAAGVLQVITRERQCQSFTPWVQGFTPKEHGEMLTLREERAWRDRREQEDREWREQVRREDQEWKTEQERRADRRNKWQTFWAIVVTGVLATVIVSAAQILGPLLAIQYEKSSSFSIYEFLKEQATSPRQRP